MDTSFEISHKNNPLAELTRKISVPDVPKNQKGHSEQISFTLKDDADKLNQLNQQNSNNLSNTRLKDGYLRSKSSEETGNVQIQETENILIQRGNSLNDLSVRFADETDDILINDGENYSIYNCKYDDDDEDESDDEDVSKHNIPDGGWGWMIVFSSFLISMIADGVSFSHGLLHHEFLFEFGESDATTAWIGSIFLAVPLLVGPICSALVDHFGCRTMTITGGVISGTGFFISSFMNSVPTMCLTYGLLAGLGLGLCYVTAVVSVCYWFDKKRTLATGLGACGTGIGTTVYAPMTRHFIDEYGWRGCVMILAGTFFNICVCGAIMREPEWWILEETRTAKLPKKKHSRSSSVTSFSERSRDSSLTGIEKFRKQIKDKEMEEYVLAVDKADDDAYFKRLNTFLSVPDLPTFVRRNEPVPLDTLELLRQNSSQFKLILQNFTHNMLICRSFSDHAIFKDEHKHKLTMPAQVIMSVKKSEKESNFLSEARHGIQEFSEPTEDSKLVKAEHKKKENISIKKNDYFRKRTQQTCSFVQPLHYLHGIRVHRNQIMYRGATLNTNRYRLRASSCPDIYKNSMTTIALETEEEWYDDIVELMKAMVDFSMFLDFHFLLVSISTTLLFTSFVVIYFYLPGLMSDHSYNDNESSLFISIIGFTNFIGMIGLGWAGDQKWMNVPMTYGVCLILCGFSTLLMPLVVDEFYALAACCVFFGLFFASNFSFTPVILVQLISIERFTTAYGLILLCQGIGNLVGPPIGGLLVDITLKTDLSFYMAGALIMAAGVLISFIPFTENRTIFKYKLVADSDTKDKDNEV